jgi:hypothetical protein
MTSVNTAIKRTRHVIPILEELRYKLNGATHFTKLGMKQGYMQLELKPESRYMTTFYTFYLLSIYFTILQHSIYFKCKLGLILMNIDHYLQHW